MKINQYSPLDHKYLQILGSIANPPKQLYIAGKLPESRQISLAIVGTRKPTAYGKEVTRQLAYELAKRGVVIVSGLALGVDGLAHQAALEAGGTTISILGNGLPKFYPASHRSLAENIIGSGGAIISEYPEGTPPIGFRFLERNRLVSGLSDGILITEAAARSGSLNTASHALEQGKDVFVVPGNITSPMSAGCNLLIKQGATPVTGPEDILEVIAPNLLKPQIGLALGNSNEETKIIKLLQSGIRDGEELQQKSGLVPSDFNQTLTILELDGAIRSLGGNQWCLK